METRPFKVGENVLVELCGKVISITEDKDGKFLSVRVKTGPGDLEYNYVGRIPAVCCEPFDPERDYEKSAQTWDEDAEAK
jgi:hypothetical protein